MGIEKRILATACGCILCGTLIAGLWPFFPPKNQVSWLDHENGLRFGEYGTVTSSADITPQGSESDCALEVWLQPGLSFDSNTILDIYTPDNPFRFRMRQSGDDLEVLRDYRDYGNTNPVKLFLDHVFLHGDAVLITVVGNSKGTSVYLNGQLAKTAPQFGLSSEDMRGQLIVGAAPVGDDRWSGKLFGLAIYSESFSPEQVLQHYRGWSQNWQPVAAADERTSALFIFAERGGRIVHNQIGLGPNLDIPRRFLVVGQAFLMPPWKEFYPGWSYYKDLIINISGFVPLGFFMCAYFSSEGGSRRAALRAILIGAATSLTIEVLQAFIPTRQSGMTDLITNTLGTELGILLFQCPLVQVLIANLRKLSHYERLGHAHLRSLSATHLKSKSGEADGCTRCEYEMERGQ